MASITKDVSIHSLRYGFAIHLLEDGATIFQVKELLDHSSIQTTTVDITGKDKEILMAILDPAFNAGAITNKALQQKLVGTE